MSAPSGSAPRDLPKLLRATFLADSEGLLRETRATGLFYFPGPILWLIVTGGLLESAMAAKYSGWPSVPYLTSWLSSGWPGDHISTIVLVFFALTLIVLLWLLYRYLKWTSTVYAVTTSRVIIQSGILGKGFDEIPIPQVRGVDVHQSVGQRILGYGTVRVSSEGGSPLGNEDWEGIPRPFEFQRLIESATQAIARGGR